MNTEIKCSSCFQINYIQDGQKLKFCSHCGAVLSFKSIANEADYSNWKNTYRRETDPLKRLKLLTESSDFFVNQQQLMSLRLLWETRFQSLPQLKQLADLDLQLMQTFVYCAQNPGWLNRRKGKKALQTYWVKKYKILCPIISDEVEIKTLIADEFYHLVYRYLELCRKDKSFNSFLFGMGQVKPETSFYRMKKQMDVVSQTFLTISSTSKTAVTRETPTSSALPVTAVMAVRTEAAVDFDLLRNMFDAAFRDYWADFPLERSD